MNKSFLIFALVLSFGQNALGQSQAENSQAQAAVQPRFEDTLSKTVVRITAQAEGVDGSLNGTGFLVEVPETRLPRDKVIVYLVTNRHVAEAMIADATGRDVGIPESSLGCSSFTALAQFAEPMTTTLAYRREFTSELSAFAAFQQRHS